ncbi:MAG: alpha/beta hydrolase [Gaiellaceae bacterium]
MATVAALVSAVLLPGFTGISAGPAGGRVLRGRYPGTQRPGYVYLPPSFDPAARYPVVYLLHGMPGSPNEYLEGTQLVQFADAAVASGSIRPFIAVIPAAGADPHYNGEWAGPWERDLVDRVVPWVDSHLPTEATASARVIAGLSAGGFGAVDIGLRHPSLFGTIESWSGYFEPLHDGPFKDASRTVLAAHDPTQLVPTEAEVLKRGRTRFFLSTGPAHSRWAPPAVTIEYARELRAYGIRSTLRVYAGHGGQWSRQVADGLRWAFPAA